MSDLEELDENDRGEPTTEARRNRYRLLAQAYLNLATCKRCKLPYNKGFVCLCGWDNSYDYPQKKEV